MHHHLSVLHSDFQVRFNLSCGFSPAVGMHVHLNTQPESLGLLFSQGEPLVHAWRNPLCFCLFLLVCHQQSELGGPELCCGLPAPDACVHEMAL